MLIANKLSLSLLFYLFTFSINLWHRKFVRAGVTYHVTYHVRPHQPIIDQQGLGLRGRVHTEAHPDLPDLH